MSSSWLQEKKIVIIGGTSGIGLSAAKAFLLEGAQVVAVGHKEEDCIAAKEKLGKNCRVIHADAINPSTAITAIDTCAREFGDFDGIYHVAGGSGRRMGDGPLHEITLDGWNKTIELNLGSLMLSNQAAIKWLLKNNKSGSILNLGSVLSYSPSPSHFATHAYTAAKSAIIGFSKSIASYYAKNNIRINVLAPGLVETPMAQRAANDPVIMDYTKTKQPLDQGRIGKAEDLDGLAVYFMSDYSRFTTGQVVAVDGGWSISDGQLQ